MRTQKSVMDLASGLYMRLERRVKSAAETDSEAGVGARLESGSEPEVRRSDSA